MKENLSEERNSPLVWIISGPTSIGKSTFIQSPRCPEITGLPLGAPVVFPTSLDQCGATDFFYHYNILRLLEQKHATGSADLVERTTDFNQDPQWNDLTERQFVKKAVVLVARRQTLMQRAAQRQIVESWTLTQQAEKPYPAAFWLSLLEKIDLAELYQAWCQELQDHAIPYILVDSNDHVYSILNSDTYLTQVATYEWLKLLTRY